MKFIGLTGGIGSGKSTVAQIFMDLGVAVYNSDTRAKGLMETSETLKKAIQKLLGEEAYVGQRLNKTYISNRIFNDKTLLEQLNAIVHPAVRTDFLAWAEQPKMPYVIQEAAIIFEIGSQNFYDQVILVTAPENIRIKRIMERDRLSTEESIQARMRNQWSDSKKAAIANYCIENVNLKKTKNQVLQIHHNLLNTP